MDDLLLYTSPDGQVRIDVVYQDETVWLTQRRMAELFGVQVPAISKHLKKIFESGELVAESVVSEMERTAADGKVYLTRFYGLDAIIAVGYRVNSRSATQFRIWATSTLREFIIKGFVLDSERLKNGPRFGADYFDELLEKIREIRASERRFYQKVTDIYAECSVDYDPAADVTRTFYATVQNKMHWAIHGKTAAELIAERADAERPNMGLTSWKSAPRGKLLKSDVAVAKNDLTQKELEELNHIVVMYLDYAELQARKQRRMVMADWAEKLDAFLRFNEYDVLDNPGRVSAHVEEVGADERAVLYDEWDARAGRYRKGWCRVYPSALPPGGGAWARQTLPAHRRTIDRLYGQLLRRRDRLRARPRSLQGADVDVDALCDAWATLAARRSPSPRLYVESARVRRDVATLVLLDVSLSTDSWVADRRVLDVARDSVLVLGEVLDRLGEEVEVLAFASHTRHKVRCWTVRGWGEPWSVGRGRLSLLSPQGYTRIGPALRHANARLAARSETCRDLILVSDCKPTDYDRYEGRHGVADVRKALAEGARVGVRTHALAIDAAASGWLPAMFGAARWSVLPSPERLPDALVRAAVR